MFLVYFSKFHSSKQPVENGPWTGVDPEMKVIETNKTYCRSHFLSIYKCVSIGDGGSLNVQVKLKLGSENEEIIFKMLQVWLENKQH